MQVFMYKIVEEPFLLYIVSPAIDPTLESTPHTVAAVAVANIWNLLERPS